MPDQSEKKSSRNRDEEMGALVRLAARGSSEEIDVLLHHGNVDVILALITNPNLKELQRIRFLRRRDLPQQVFAKLAGNRDWMKDQAVRQALARNPKTPQHVFQPLLQRFLVMDLIRVAQDPYVTADRRVFINRLLTERVGGLPVGTKINLAKRASADVCQALLLHDPPPKLVDAILPNPSLTERALVRAIGAGIRQEESLTLIAAHAQWGKPHGIRLALAKHPATAEGHRRRILTTLTVYDLREVLSDCAGHRHIVELTHEELNTRPGDGRSKSRRPLTQDEIQGALAAMKQRRKGAPPPPKQSAAEIRGAAVRREDVPIRDHQLAKPVENSNGGRPGQSAEAGPSPRTKTKKAKKEKRGAKRPSRHR